MAQWDKIEDKGNVEDRRGSNASIISGVGLVGVVIYLLFTYLTGGDVVKSLIQVANVALEDTQTNVNSSYNPNYADFASKVIGSNNSFWAKKLIEENIAFTQPKLVLFRGVTDSACGGASSDMGPHYCPVDKTIYLDETFFEELKNRFGAQGGDVAEAYVIGHEYGHHVQEELGILSSKSTKIKQIQDKNAISIKTELMADCLSGMWVASLENNGVIRQLEVGEAIDAAKAVGDDKIQIQTSGHINPENWTHGSSKERIQAFNTGFNSKTISSCDTFSN